MGERGAPAHVHRKSLSFASSMSCVSLYPMRITFRMLNPLVFDGKIATTRQDLVISKPALERACPFTKLLLVILDGSALSYYDPEKPCLASFLPVDVRLCD